VAKWAVVIGVDEYGRKELALTAAVRDAELFRAWALAEDGGQVPEENLLFLAARTGEGDAGYGVPTRDRVVAAINEVLARSGESGEAFYFFFAGHGLTTWVTKREEGALLTPGFDTEHPEHSLAIRSVLEFFETVQFQDQFFFIDACRNAPQQDFVIGRWPIPRRRDPGKGPVQQFVLYATSPGLTAAQDRWEGMGEFTKVLMDGLGGRAKAWSWNGNCYEVRWEKLASFINERMKEARVATSPSGKRPEGGWPIQIPQDTGSRGVAGRQRDALLATIPRTGVEPLKLTIKLKADPAYKLVDVDVLDAVAAPVASVVKFAGDAHEFLLPPKTYAVVAESTDERYGRVDAPIDLYEGPIERSIKLAPQAPEVGEDKGRGSIVVESKDPLTIVELRNEAGEVLEATKVDGASGTVTFDLPVGFYRVRLIGPPGPGEEQFVVLGSGPEVRADEPRPVEASERTTELAEAAGARYDSDRRAVVFGEDEEWIEWAEPSTIMAVELGHVLSGKRKSALLESPVQALGKASCGVAFHAVAAAEAEDELRVRAWPAGTEVPREPQPLERSQAATVSFAAPAKPGPWWLSIEQGKAQTVLALPVLEGRLATVIAELGEERPRVYQFHPSLQADPSSSPERLRRIEHLQRLVLAGRVDGAAELARKLAAHASGDPFAALLAGYALLRSGLFDQLPKIADEVAAVAPGWSDPYILRGEAVAHAQGREPDLAARDQAFTQAVNTGIPIFGEGLTRLIEGLRASGFSHPRGTLVRHIFQRHARGLMWAAFTPLRPLDHERLVISGADLGYEG
jgi:hypothetical protein